MDHQKLSTLDKITLIGELQHIRAHALRSSKVAEKDEDKFFYQVIASQAQEARRAYMAKHFQLDEKDWCLVKAAATLKQLNYELAHGDETEFAELENLADSILSHATGEDLTGCESCAKDATVVKSE